MTTLKNNMDSRNTLKGQSFTLINHDMNLLVVEPITTGTEKQIDWALSIKCKTLRDTIAYFENLELSTNPNINQEMVATGKAKVLGALNQITDAKICIDCLNQKEIQAIITDIMSDKFNK